MKLLAELSTLKDTNSTSVDGSSTIIPAFCMPMKAMKRPIPTGIAWRTPAGIAANIFCLKPVTVRMTKITPSMRVNTMLLA